MVGSAHSGHRLRSTMTVVPNIGSDVQTHCFPKRRQSSGALLPNIGSAFPTSFGRHTSGTPGLKGDRPDHSAAMFPAVRPIGRRILETTCQALHLKTPRKKQFRAVQLCDMWGSAASVNGFRGPSSLALVAFGQNKGPYPSHVWPAQLAGLRIVSSVKYLGSLFEDASRVEASEKCVGAFEDRCLHIYCMLLSAKERVQLVHTRCYPVLQLTGAPPPPRSMLVCLHAALRVVFGACN